MAYFEDPERDLRLIVSPERALPNGYKSARHHGRFDFRTSTWNGREVGLHGTSESLSAPGFNVNPIAVDTEPLDVVVDTRQHAFNIVCVEGDRHAVKDSKRIGQRPYGGGFKDVHTAGP